MWNEIYHNVTTRDMRRRLASQSAWRWMILLVLLGGLYHIVGVSTDAWAMDTVDDAVVEHEILPPLLHHQSKQQQQPLHNKEVSCGGHWEPSCDKCPRGNGASWCNGECMWKDNACIDRPSYVHPEYHQLLKQYPFQPVVTEKGEYVNIILVRSPFQHGRQAQMYDKYKDEILFLGISSFESYPLNSPNPYSKNFSNDEYRGLFPGFLTMMPHPESYFAPHVKTILLSESDFNLDGPLQFGQKFANAPKLYDFTFSGTDQDVHNNCVGWSSYAKNWTFTLEALKIMCSDEFNLKGVLVATKDKSGKVACTIPKECQGKMIQTTFLGQDEFFTYLAKSKFAFLPQVYDASPRVSTQALSMNVPLLMNDNIVGGWKYINQRTGEFFHDIHDFKQSLRRLLDRIDHYKPREYVTESWGNANVGPQFLKFVQDNWPDRVTIPEGTKWLKPAGA
uniref:Uncharacterized protein n=1 Tax=Amphora coffeiformis TaxID=265554 RepID=A0A7S3KYG5_9STRA|mmetsp:Transcript_11173/g.21273  ORF Transcript_11173/g.21273 Transcript_11173/m.21273 type:complete len:449 (-) Transcript_11173:404-1750(-)|eukprot:scaffold2050_cov167-Amphora_coffeaeformis.AAC.6